jgi:hypothetical protein
VEHTELHAQRHAVRHGHVQAALRARLWKGSLIHDAKGNPPLLNDEGVKVAPARKNNVEWIAEGKSRHWKYQK